jgi:hypothetical protein
MSLQTLFYVGRHLDLARTLPQRRACSLAPYCEASQPVVAVLLFLVLSHAPLQNVTRLSRNVALRPTKCLGCDNSINSAEPMLDF